MIYKLNDTVLVKLPEQTKTGVIKKVLPKYSLSGETHYEIHDTEFVTITSCRSMKIKRVRRN